MEPTRYSSISKQSCVLWSSCDSSCSQGHVTLWRHSWQGYEWRRSSERFLNPRAAALSQAFALNCGIFTQINRPLVKMRFLYAWFQLSWQSLLFDQGVIVFSQASTRSLSLTPQSFTLLCYLVQMLYWYTWSRRLAQRNSEKICRSMDRRFC